MPGRGRCRTRHSLELRLHLASQSGASVRRQPSSGKTALQPGAGPTRTWAALLGQPNAGTHLPCLAASMVSIWHQNRSHGRRSLRKFCDRFQVLLSYYEISFHSQFTAPGSSPRTKQEPCKASRQRSSFDARATSRETRSLSSSQAQSGDSSATSA